jgi:hypothetical protein
LILFADGSLKDASNLARNQAKVGGANGNLDRRKPVLNLVKNTRGPLFRRVNASIVGPDRLHDVVPLSELFQELRDDFRRMLQIAVHQEGSVSITVIQARNQRHLVPEST